MNAPEQIEPEEVFLNGGRKNLSRPIWNAELEAKIFESVPLDVWKYGKTISCPVLAIRGEHSDAFCADAAERLKNVIADWEFVTLSNAGHFVPMEKPQECAQVITEFISGII